MLVPKVNCKSKGLETIFQNFGFEQHWFYTKFGIMTLSLKSPSDSYSSTGNHFGQYMSITLIYSNSLVNLFSFWSNCSHFGQLF